MVTLRGLPVVIAIVFVTTYFVYVYPFFVLSHFIFGTDIFNSKAFLLTIISASAVLFYYRSYNTFWLLKRFVYEGLGLGFISFWIVNFGLFFEYMSGFNSAWVGIGCIVVIASTVAYSLVKGRLINFRYLEVISPRVAEEIIVIFLSDTHLGSNSKTHLDRIVKKIMKEKCDLLLIGGDFIDASSFNLEDLYPLKEIKVPILFVTGNHEYYVKDYETKLEKLCNFGITVLSNNSFEIGRINVVGVDDNQDLHSQEKVAKELVKQKYFNIVMVHKPSLWERVLKDVDLVLSGHTHNGQIFPFNFFVRLRFKQTYGLYKRLGSLLYVSSGSGCWGPKMRLGSQNEIVQIRIAPTQVVEK